MRCGHPKHRRVMVPVTFTPIAVMEMLERLHQLGYQRLRLSSGSSPNGAAWRYGIAPASQFEPGGYLLKGGSPTTTAFASTRGDDAPFGWPDGGGLDADALARLFLERFPAVAAAGWGDDPDYAAWFGALLEASRPRGAPVMFGEYVDVAADGCIRVGDTRVPLPPP